MASWIQLNATLLCISSGKSGLQPKVADMVIRTVFLTFYYPHVKKKLYRLSPQDTQGSQDEFSELQLIPDFQQGDGGMCSELKDQAGEMKNLARIGLPLFCLSLPGGPRREKQSSLRCHTNEKFEETKDRSRPRSSHPAQGSASWRSLPTTRLLPAPSLGPGPRA